MLISALALAQPAWKADPHLVILHQGAALAAPASTHIAFEEAYRQGADGIEIHLRRTRDKIWVVTPEDHLVRDYGPWRRISDLTFEECRNVDLARGWGHVYPAAPVPLALDVFKFCRAAGMVMILNIEDYKQVDEAEEVLDLLEAAKAQSNVLAPSSLADGKSNFPPIATSWSWRQGGEEDPGLMKTVISRLTEPTTLTAADARSLSWVLGRRPGLRPQARFVDSKGPWRPAGDPLAYRDGYGARELPELGVQPYRMPKTNDYARALSPYKRAIRAEALTQIASADSAEARLQAAWNLGKLMQVEDAGALLNWAAGQLDGHLSTEPWSKSEYDRLRKLVGISGIARIRLMPEQNLLQSDISVDGRIVLSFPGGAPADAWESAVAPHDFSRAFGFQPKDPLRRTHHVVHPLTVNWMLAHPEQVERILEQNRWMIMTPHNALDLLGFLTPGTRLHTFCVFLAADSRMAMMEVQTRFSQLYAFLTAINPDFPGSYLSARGEVRPRTWYAVAHWTRPELRVQPSAIVETAALRSKLDAIRFGAQQVLHGGIDAELITRRILRKEGPFDPLATRNGPIPPTGP